MLSTFTMSAGMLSFQHYKSKYIQHHKQMPSWDVKNKNITYLISLVCLANNFFFYPFIFKKKMMGTGLILLYSIELRLYLFLIRRNIVTLSLCIIQQLCATYFLQQSSYFIFNYRKLRDQLLKKCCIQIMILYTK